MGGIYGGSMGDGQHIWRSGEGIMVVTVVPAKLGGVGKWDIGGYLKLLALGHWRQLIMSALVFVMSSYGSRSDSGSEYSGMSFCNAQVLS